jgi:hypothetical protein
MAPAAERPPCQKVDTWIFSQGKGVEYFEVDFEYVQVNRRYTYADIFHQQLLPIEIDSLANKEA